jgi:cell division protein FtsN
MSNPDATFPLMDTSSPLVRNAFIFGGGVLLGLVIAALLAVYITNAPVPFVNKVQRPTETVVPGADGKLPDPNKPLYSTPKSVEPPKMEPAKNEARTDTAAADGKGAAKADASAPAKSAAVDDTTRFLLQAGAFRTPEDADAMRARLAMLGLDARIFPIDQGDRTLYRVRLGPYGQMDDINRIRKSLAENGIDAQVVRLR